MNLLDIEKPIIINDILHHKDNLEILEYLFSFGKFNVGLNNTVPGARLKRALLNNVQHEGFTCPAKEEDEKFSIENPVNVYAFVIVNQLSKILGFDYKEIQRIYYNYYCQNQFATEHIDSEKEDEISILYNLHTTDGGTIILGQKYQDKASQAKIFKSKWLHSSYSTVKDKGRVSLNIKFKI